MHSRSNRFLPRNQRESQTICPARNGSAQKSRRQVFQERKELLGLGLAESAAPHTRARKPVFEKLGTIMTVSRFLRLRSLSTACQQDLGREAWPETSEFRWFSAKARGG